MSTLPRFVSLFFLAGLWSCGTVSEQLSSAEERSRVRSALGIGAAEQGIASLEKSLNELKQQLAEEYESRSDAKLHLEILERTVRGDIVDRAEIEKLTRNAARVAVRDYGAETKQEWERTADDKLATLGDDVKELQESARILEDKMETSLKSKGAVLRILAEELTQSLEAQRALRASMASDLARMVELHDRMTAEADAADLPYEGSEAVEALLDELQARAVGSDGR